MQARSNPKPITGFSRFLLDLAASISVLFAFVSVTGLILLCTYIGEPKQPESPNHGFLIAIFAGASFLTIWLTIFLVKRLKNSDQTRFDTRQASPFVCARCQHEAPVKELSFDKHIASSTGKNHTTFKGSFCKPCAASVFWEFTSTTFFLGWWSMVSCIVTPVTLSVNIVSYLRSLCMNITPRLSPPVLTEEAVALLKPQQNRILEALQSKKSLEPLSREIAEISGVSPGQAYLFIGSLNTSV